MHADLEVLVELAGRAADLLDQMRWAARAAGMLAHKQTMCTALCGRPSTIDPLPPTVWTPVACTLKCSLISGSAFFSSFTTGSLAFAAGG